MLRWLQAASKAAKSPSRKLSKQGSVLTVFNKFRRSKSTIDARRQSTIFDSLSHLSISSQKSLRRSSVANPMMPRIEVSSPDSIQCSRRNTVTKLTVTKSNESNIDMIEQEPLYKSHSTACIRRKTSLTPSLRQASAGQSRRESASRSHGVNYIKLFPQKRVHDSLF